MVFDGLVDAFKNAYTKAVEAYEEGQKEQGLTRKRKRARTDDDEEDDDYKAEQSEKRKGTVDNEEVVKQLEARVKELEAQVKDLEEKLEDRDIVIAKYMENRDSEEEEEEEDVKEGSKENDASEEPEEVEEEKEEKPSTVPVLKDEVDLSNPQQTEGELEVLSPIKPDQVQSLLETSY
jgi:predicted RNase H-like nuclease (RuvC/YqgF family)